MKYFMFSFNKLIDDLIFIDPGFSFTTIGAGVHTGLRRGDGPFGGGEVSVVLGEL